MTWLAQVAGLYRLLRKQAGIAADFSQVACSSDDVEWIVASVIAVREVYRACASCFAHSIARTSGASSISDKDVPLVLHVLSLAVAFEQVVMVNAAASFQRAREVVASVEMILPSGEAFSIGQDGTVMVAARGLEMHAMVPVVRAAREGVTIRDAADIWLGAFQDTQTCFDGDVDVMELCTASGLVMAEASTSSLGAVGTVVGDGLGWTVAILSGLAHISDEFDIKDVCCLARSMLENVNIHETACDRDIDGTIAAAWCAMGRRDTASDDGATGSGACLAALLTSTAHVLAATNDQKWYGGLKRLMDSMAATPDEMLHARKCLVAASRAEVAGRADPCQEGLMPMDANCTAWTLGQSAFVGLFESERVHQRCVKGICEMWRKVLQ